VFAEKLKPENLNLERSAQHAFAHFVQFVHNEHQQN
jgi:hypothetical protein